MIAQAALTVVLRKDMSLNRRLYAWILGPNQKISVHNREVLVRALKRMFYTDTTDMTEIAKPYKVLLSLLDKSEIGSPILERVLVDILQAWKKKEDQGISRREVRIQYLL